MQRRSMQHGWGRKGPRDGPAERAARHARVRGAARVREGERRPEREGVRHGLQRERVKPWPVVAAGGPGGHQEKGAVSPVCPHPQSEHVRAHFLVK